MTRGPGRDQRGPSWRLAGLGVELAVTVGAFVAIGLWIDWHYRVQPWGVLICVVLGLVGGMYNFIRQALRASREMEEKERNQYDRRSGKDA